MPDTCPLPLDYSTFHNALTLREVSDFYSLVSALPFIEPNLVESTLSELRVREWDPESPNLERNQEFQRKFCDYIENVYIK